MIAFVTGRGSRRREPRCGASRTLLICVLAFAGGCQHRADPAPTIAKEDSDAAQALHSLINKARAARDDSRRATALPASLIVPKFVEVADQVGIQHFYYSDTQPGRYFLPEIMGGGAGWFDFDLDGWLDVYYANGCPLTSEPPENPADYFGKLFRNRGNGTFGDVTLAAAAGECRYGQGVAVGDFDADGFPDVFLANYGPDVLLHNLGDGTFEQVTASAGMEDQLWGSGAAWFDADRDGDLDLYVVNYLDVTFKTTRVCEYLANKAKGFCGPGEYEAVPDFLYVNQGDGTFVESLDAWGMTAQHGKGLVISVLDFDGDLLPEVYVGNDMTANFLFASSDSASVKKLQRATDKPFVEIGATAGCAVSGAGLNEATMGIACADYDRDQLVDIYLTHFFNNKNTLYRNLGKLTFTDDSFRTRVAATSMAFNGFGCAALDYDRDGWMDLLITNGHVLGPEFEPNVMRPQLLRNDGRATFSDISQLAGSYFQEQMLGRGLAAADYDNDGDVDVTVSHLDRPVAVLRNDTPTHRNFLGLELRTRNRIPAIGGRVVVHGAGSSQMFPIQTGGSYESAADSRLVAGLADERGPIAIDVYWPSGAVDQWKDLQPNKYYVLYQGIEPRPDLWPPSNGTGNSLR